MYFYIYNLKDNVNYNLYDKIFLRNWSMIWLTIVIWVQIGLIGDWTGRVDTYLDFIESDEVFH